MPYIKQEDRAGFDSVLQHLQVPKTAGELNYVFTWILIQYLRTNGKNYQHINDVIGALEGAKMEAYRRLAGPYEDQKIAENGDVQYEM